MRRTVFIFLFLLFFIPAIHSQELLQPVPIEETIFNALNLSEEQTDCLEQFLCRNISEKEFKKSLTRQQRSKYSMIKKIMRLECKKNKYKKNYYAKNPQMQQFGDECIIQKYKNAVNK